MKQYLPEVFSSHPGEYNVGSGPDRLQSFKASLRNDVQGIKDIEERIDCKSLTSFLDALEGCQGQIIVSGIGEHAW